MSDLPEELRDRAARAAREAYGRSAPSLSGVNLDRWLVVVDAVAEVLAGHLKKHCLNCNNEVDALDQMLEIDYSRPAQRVAIELVELREENKRLRAGPAGAHPAESED